MFRTLNRDMGLPNHNDDYLAERLRDELMPLRSWMLKHLPGSKAQLKVRHTHATAYLSPRWLSCAAPLARSRLHAHYPCLPAFSCPETALKLP